MKTVNWTPDASWDEVLLQAGQEDVLVLRDGHPMVLMTPFDDDGAVDLAVATGRVRHASAAAGTGSDSFLGRYAERNQLFAGDGHGRFRDVSLANRAFCGAAAISRGLACGDVDNDGGMDLLVTSVGGRARLYRNTAPHRGHWLVVRVVDPALKRDAYGARVAVTAGGVRSVRWVNPAGSYLCSNDPRAHFGLGTAQGVEKIEVSWPDGTEEVFPAQTADRMIVLRRGESIAAPSPPAPRASAVPAAGR